MRAFVVTGFVSPFEVREVVATGPHQSRRSAGAGPAPYATPPSTRPATSRPATSRPAGRPRRTVRV
jgi:hypothetical protein